MVELGLSPLEVSEDGFWISKIRRDMVSVRSKEGIGTSSGLLWITVASHSRPVAPTGRLSWMLLLELSTEPAVSLALQNVGGAKAIVL